MHCHIDISQFFHFTVKKHQRDDDDSGMGPTIFTDTKSTTYSEVITHYLTKCMCVHISILSSALGSTGQRAEGNRL